MRKLIRKARLIYETRIIPWLLFNCRWIFWPVYKILKLLNICFVVNINGAPGHMLPELDFFCRKKYLKKIDNRKRYVWIRKSDEHSRICIKLYGRNFWFAISNNLIYDLCLPWMVGFKDISEDCGYSRLKWQIPKKKEELVKDGSCLYQTDKKEGMNQLIKYIQLINESKDYLPLKQQFTIPEDLKGFIGDNTKVALIHIKENIVNATACPTDPYTYIETIDFLKNLGYQLIFIGREKMPDCFVERGVKNYANSSIASFEYDFFLFSIADLAIVAGSGIAFFSDILGVPYLYLNSWHIARAMNSPFCIIIPTIAKDKNGRFLSFSEQIDLDMKFSDKGCEIFPLNEYKAINASSDEILEATKELLSLKSCFIHKSALQEKYQKEGRGFSLQYVESRCSDYFLKKHENLLNEMQ